MSLLFILFMLQIVNFLLYVLEIFHVEVEHENHSWFLLEYDIQWSHLHRLFLLQRKLLLLLLLEMVTKHFLYYHYYYLNKLEKKKMSKKLLLLLLLTVYLLKLEEEQYHFFSAVANESGDEFEDSVKSIVASDYSIPVFLLEIKFFVESIWQ